ncbi:PREDICTED: putative leucine-rich repeat-containing protein DDB_G0290503 [Polistes dominula]|uniref:Leucine-rich repeat-containing protein DDB_G0290503 n=1 Tax=Polistes dominula TaxID=743375 RepID=A0ABM1JDJ2_POLDO|nr:PREDICTED: putative leucine-rich repeat-containing protein DDB_G0290503 [Polistes dominula]
MSKQLRRATTKNDDSFEMKINNLRNVLAEAEDDIMRGTANKLRDNIVKMREKFACEKKRFNNEIQRLKRRVKEAEEKRWYSNGQIQTIGQLKSKLKEFVNGDRTMEIIIKHIVERMATTVPNLSEELVNANEDLYKSNCENAQLRYEIDKIKAMLRIQTGDPENYRKRIIEFKTILRGLKKNVCFMKKNLDDSSYNDTFDFENYVKAIKKIDMTINELRNKLRNDRRALITTGNPNRFRYLTKIVEVRLILKQLHEELENSLTLAEKYKDDENEKTKKGYVERVEILEKIIEQTNIELSSLKIEPVANCKLSGTSCLEYLKKVTALNETLKRYKEKINELDKNLNEDNSRTSRSMTLEELRKLINELYYQSRDLESVVYSGNQTKLFGRIEELEELLVKSKVELSNKMRGMSVLEKKLECSKKELDETREKNMKLSKEIDEFEKDSRNRSEEIRRMKAELNSLTTQLQTLRNDKKNLYTETEKMNKLLMERNEELSKIRTTKLKLEKSLETTSKQLNEESKKSMRTLTERERQLQSELNEATLESKVDCYDKENNKLKAEILELEAVGKTVKTTMDELNKKNNSLLEQVAKFQIIQSSLEEEANNWKKRSNEFASVLERINEKLRDLRTKNLTLSDDLSGLTMKNNETEALLRVISTEKNHLMTRTKELNEENFSLKDCLNKTRTEREYLSVELNKLKIEFDETKSNNSELKRTIEELQGNYNKVKNEYRILDNRARNLLVSNEALRSENDELKARSNEFLKRLQNLEFNDENDIRLYENEETENRKAMECEKSSDKIKIKGKLKNKNDTKKLKLANESLKFQLTNLKTENMEIKLELARIKDHLGKDKRSDQLEITEFRNVYMKSQKNETWSPRIEQNCRQIVLSNETNNETLNSDLELREKFDTLTNILSKMRIVNGALKTEIDILRDSMHAAITDKEKTVSELRRAFDELKALKVELIKLRNEKQTLGIRLDEAKQEVDNLKIEKIALKDELTLLRKTNFDLRTKIGDLQNSYVKLKTLDSKLESKLVGTLKNVSKYTVSVDNSHEFENLLNGILKDYTSMKESLGIVNFKFDDCKFAQGEIQRKNMD